MVVRTLVCRHLSLIQPLLIGDPYVWGNRLHGNVCGWHRPSLDGCRRFCDSSPETGKLKNLVELGLHEVSDRV